MDDKTIRAAMGCSYCCGDDAIFAAERDMIFVDQNGNLDVFCGENGDTPYLRAKVNYCPMCGTSLPLEAMARGPLPGEPNEPMTLDELREMDGQPVWFQLANDKWVCYLIYQMGREPIALGASIFATGTTERVEKLMGEGFAFYRRPPEVLP